MTSFQRTIGAGIVHTLVAAALGWYLLPTGAAGGGARLLYWVIGLAFLAYASLSLATVCRITYFQYKGLALQRHDPERFDAMRRRYEAAIGHSPATATAMTPSKAQSLVQHYGRVLTDSSSATPTLLRPQSSLPASREQIQSAIRILLPLANPEDAQALMAGYMDLGSFVPDDQAHFANSGLQRRDAASLQQANAILKASNAECERLLVEVRRYVDTLAR